LWACGLVEASYYGRSFEEESDMKFVRLKRGNDWGADYLAVEPLTEHGMADARRRIPLESGQIVVVKFPDGTSGQYPVVMCGYSTSVSDMGNNYPVHYDLPGIQIESHGLKTWICLDEVDILVDESNKPLVTELDPASDEYWFSDRKESQEG
jgi:hypothetical protein